MENKRMQQLVFMFSDITGISEEKAEKIIMQTDTGQAVKTNNQTVMYEQQTENLCSIAMELGRSEQSKAMETKLYRLLQNSLHLRYKTRRD